MDTFKKFLSYYKPYRVSFAFDMVCAFILSVVDLFIPLIASFLIREVLILEDKTLMFDTVSKYILIMLALYIVRMLATYYVTSYGHIMGVKMETDMRTDLFTHVEKLSFSYFDECDTGVIMSNIITDLFDVTELAHHGPEDIFISVTKIIGSLIILSSINTSLTFYLFTIIIIMLLFTFFLNKRVKGIFRDNRKKIGNVNSILQDSLSGIRVVQSFANEDVELEKFEKGSRAFFESKSRAYINMGIYHSINGFFHALLYMTVFFMGGYLIKQGRIDAPSVLTYILYVNILLEPITRLINFTELFQKGYTGFERMQEVMRISPDIVDSTDAEPLKDVKGEIVLKNVSFKYNGEPENTLSNISFTIPVGETHALVGSSGVGKTTLCSLIPRFYDVSDGEILIDGKNIKDLKLGTLRDNIGIVQQDVYLFNTTVRDNIAYGNPKAGFEEIVKAAKKAYLHDFIMSLKDGYDTIVGEQGVKFSGGQKQRVSIARVFLKNPPILILDEATSALDNESEKFIKQSLEELAKDRTTLLIAHRLSTIRNADQIIVLKKDGIAERGNHKDLLERDGDYADLYNVQFES